ncbi:PRD domain-containing protein [Bavariicoccus seileri]|uniref:PRD domain-containing protein n=1 Tax=Bavariicoccus seileri TaxID=549685 RepID=UPI003F8E559A
MYYVVKPLNNNVAIVKDGKHDQAVVMGGGIAFQKRKGDTIHRSQVEKIFTLKNGESENNFLTLLKNVPLDFITACYEIIEEAKTVYHYPVQEYIYVTLTDHVFLNYQNYKRGTYEKSKLPDLRKDYPVEFKIGEMGVKKLNEKLGISFPDSEISRLALHFINAKSTSNEDQKIELNERELITLVKSELKKHGIVRTTSNENYFNRLMIHLTYLLERVDLENDSDTTFTKKFEKQLSEDYPTAYQIGTAIYEKINDFIGREMAKSERVYFTIHIQRLL